MKLHLISTSIAAALLASRAFGEGFQSQINAVSLTAPPLLHSLTLGPTDFASPGATPGVAWVAGLYDIRTTLTTLQTTPLSFNGYLAVNGAVVTQFDLLGTPSNYRQGTIETLRFLQPGDTFSVQIDSLNPVSILGNSLSMLSASVNPLSSGVQANIGGTLIFSNSPLWQSVPLGATRYASPGMTACTVTTAGVYQLGAKLTLQPFLSNGPIQGRLVVNGVPVDSFIAPSGASNEVTLSALRSLQPGDTYGVEILNQSGNNLKLPNDIPHGGSNITALTAPLMSGIQSQLGSGSTVFNPAPDWQDVPFGTTDFATDGITPGTAWLNGVCDLVSTLTVEKSGSGAVQGRLLVNGAPIDNFYIDPGTTAGGTYEMALSGVRALQPGDTYGIQILNGSSAPITIDTGAGTLSSISVWAVPEPASLAIFVTLPIFLSLRRRSPRRGWEKK